MNVKYEMGQYVRCVDRTFENVEMLNVGEVYSVVGITPTTDDVIYTVRDKSGNLYHSIDRFEVVETKVKPSTETRSMKELPNDIRYKMLQSSMLDTYMAKNKDYGNSFTKTFEDYGLLSVVIRLSDKYLRLRQLISTGEAEVKDESVRDTLLDMANYAMMAVMELDGEKEVSVGSALPPCQNSMTYSQRCYIAALTYQLGLDRYDLPAYLSVIPIYKDLTEAEASVLIDKLVAIKSYKESEGNK